MRKLFEAIEESKEKVDNRTVVRVRSTYWYSGDALNHKKEIKFLRRKCSGNQFIEDDVGNASAEDVFNIITNWDRVNDGVYEVIMNTSTDWETGYVDEWDYTLIPYEEND